MNATSDFSTPWPGPFASAGAQLEHEQRATRMAAWLRRIFRDDRSSHR